MVRNSPMMPQPLVSVCVVTYNHGPYIRDCLMSVIAQSADVSLELLVGDDRSTDGTSAIVDEIALAYPGIVRVIRPGERTGSGSRNLLHLLPEVRGQYVAHLDGDDFWLPGKLRAQLAYLDCHPGIDAVYANALVVDDAGRARGAFNAQVPDEFDLGFLLRQGNFLCHGSLLYRARHVSRFLALSPPVLDYRFHIELARSGRLGYVSACLVGYRVASATSISVANSPLVRRLYLDVLAAVGQEARWRDDLGWAYGQFLAITLWDFTVTRQWRDMVALAGRAWRDSPSSGWLLSLRVLALLAGHARFKAANFLARVVLRRPLKVYFPR
jgi:glycosyltransferase involved in cell wall biosynthesis